ncbi:MAG TPA: cytochrome D1 [Anaerolineae bacterium]|nr:cytochrome D1 [Anaerolineae bacterium]
MLNLFHRSQFIVLLLFAGLLLATGCSRAQDKAATPTPGPADTARQEDAGHHSEADEQPAEPVIITDSITVNGVTVAFSAAPFSVVPDGPTAVTEGEYALISFKLTDAETGESLSALHPSAWLAAQPDAADSDCQENIQSYLQGALTFRPEIDLNGYFILVMNNDASISVLDPTADVAGMTQLYDMVLLNRPGEDWLYRPDTQQLLVTMPGANQVAVVDGESFDISQSAAAGTSPTRIALAPDGQTVWVGNDAQAAAESGVTVLDAATLEIAAQIPTGAGHHEIAFAPDGATAFVTNSQANTLSVIDTARLVKVEDIEIGAQPTAVTAGPDGVIYAANAGDGSVVALDSATHEATAVYQAAPGIAGFWLTADGRWGFAPSPAEDKVYIFDTAAGNLAYAAPAAGAPDQVTFSDTTVYIRASEAPAVTAIPLAELGQADSLPVTTLPVGQRAPAEAAGRASAPAIFPVAADGAALVVNPADRLIYYYPEGAAAAAGSFQAHGRIPRAVMTVSRSLEEVEPGMYTAKVRMPQSGRFQAAFFLDSPQAAHCFTFTAEENPVYAASRADETPRVELVGEKRPLTAGQPYTLQFRLAQPRTAEPVSNLTDVQALATLPTGWNNRFAARPLDDGVYEATLTIPAAGPTYVYFAIPSMQLDFEDLSNVTFNTEAGDESP